MFPFFESTLILGQLALLVVCAVFTTWAIYQRVRHKRASLLIVLPALLTLLPVSCMVVTSLLADDIEYNPWISSSQALVGIYQANDQTLVLRADGTYTATGFAEMKSGNWSNYDWNLHLSDCRLTKPRVMTRNGHLCIAPFYRDVDAPIGLLLEKQNNP